jgi:hypothetical protein
MARGKKPAAEQPELPGVEKKIEAVHKLGLELAGVRSDRMELTKREVELAKKIMEAMKAEKLIKYNVEGLELEIVTVKEKVRVKLDIDNEGDEGGEGAEGNEGDNEE